MATHNDGEFELVLGNKQLLSVFFIVAVLIGVFFTMGYIVGRNSAPGIAAAADTGPRRPDKSVDAPQRPSATGTPVSAPQSATPVVDSDKAGAGSDQKPPDGAASGGAQASTPDSKGNDQ